MKTLDVEQILAQMTLEEKAQMCAGRDFWHTRDIPRLGVPSVMMCDGPNGLRKQKGKGDHLGINESIETVCYPTASAVASSFDTQLLRELGELLGQECQAEEVGMLLGPGINMKRSPLCGRNFEYYSEDPCLAGKMAAAYIQGLQSQGVAACVKHFAANNQETRRMSGSSQVEERALRELYLPAFETAVKEGKAGSVMCAYNAINGTFCSENKRLLTDILRGEWGFDGFVVTDWGAVKDRVKGLEAGVDLEMPGGAGKEEAILKAVQEGILPKEVLNQAVRNILCFVKWVLDHKKENASFDRGTAREKARRLAAECAVLLKNDGVLPLAQSSKIAFIGAFAQTPRYQGAGSSHINERHPSAALDFTDGWNITYAKGYEPKDTAGDGALIAEALQAAKQSDCAVIFAGLPEFMESEGGDRTHMSLPENQRELIEQVAAVQKHTVVVLHGGSPVELPWFDQVSGILLMHLGGSNVGAATMDLLTGRVNPSGRMAETWPLRVEDNPSYLNFPGENGVVHYRENLFIGYRYYDKKKMPVRFPFGYGLSYTAFAYSDLQMKGSLEVSCLIKNTGSREGMEVAQLYVGAKSSRVNRPVKELKGFSKLTLKPGEEKRVSFCLGSRDFSYYEEQVQGWFLERGTYVISIGSSVQDIHLSAEVTVESADELPVVYTQDSMIGDLFLTERGKAQWQKISQRTQMSEAAKKENKSAMGEGAETLARSMMMEMPLRALHTYGRMSREELDEMLAELTQE
jgi:Beta-glucosidase-related glycosidases